MTKPVYIINGFLESGKTEFITFTLGQPYFQIKGRTLLILCEEGENEYDPALLKKSRTDVVLIEEEEEFNPNHLIELEKQYKPARIIIEYNGMCSVNCFCLNGPLEESLYAFTVKPTEIKIPKRYKPI